MSTIDWSQLYRQRKSVAKKFGTIWKIPVARRYYDVLNILGRKAVTLLEIGAGDRRLKERLQAFWGEVDYKSCDIDSTYDHEFNGIDEVEGEFEIICAVEMIEHVSLEDAHHLISKCYEHSAPNGYIAITTPNIYYPPSFLRDSTHITAFCYDELGGLMQLCGYEVTGIYRLYHDSFIKQLVKRVLMYPFFRVLGIDFAHRILVVAKKRP